MFETATELLNNIRLLGFNPEVHSRGQLTGDLDPNLFMNNGDNSKLFQVITFFLFRCLDKKRAEKEFEGCFPITSRSQASIFLNKTCAWLEEMKRSSPLLRHVQIRRSYLIDCRGAEINKIMVAFSTFVLQKVLARDGVSTDLNVDNTPELEQAIQSIHADFRRLQDDRDGFMQTASMQAREYSEILNSTRSTSASSSATSGTEPQQSVFPNTAQLKSSLRKPLIDVEKRLSRLQALKRKYNHFKEKAFSEAGQQRRVSYDRLSTESGIKFPKTTTTTAASATIGPSTVKRRRFELKDILPIGRNISNEKKPTMDNVGLYETIRPRTTTNVPTFNSQHTPNNSSLKTPPLYRSRTYLSNDELGPPISTSGQRNSTTSSYLQASPVSTSSARLKVADQLNHNTASNVQKSPSTLSVMSKHSTRSSAQSSHKHQFSDSYDIDDDQRLYSQTPPSKHTPSPARVSQHVSTKTPLLSASPSSLQSLRTPEATSFQSSPFSPSIPKTTKAFSPASYTSKTNTTVEEDATPTDTQQAATIEIESPNFHQELANALNQPAISSIKCFVILPRLEELRKLASSMNDGTVKDGLAFNVHISWTPPLYQPQRRQQSPPRRSSSIMRSIPIGSRTMTERETTANTLETKSRQSTNVSSPRERSIVDSDGGRQHTSVFDKKHEVDGDFSTDNNDTSFAASPRRRYSGISESRPSIDIHGDSNSTLNNSTSRLDSSDSSSHEQSHDKTPERLYNRSHRQSLTSMMNSIKSNSHSSNAKEGTDVDQSRHEKALSPAELDAGQNSKDVGSSKDDQSSPSDRIIDNYKSTAKRPYSAMQDSMPSAEIKDSIADNAKGGQGSSSKGDHSGATITPSTKRQRTLSSASFRDANEDDKNSPAISSPVHNRIFNSPLRNPHESTPQRVMTPLRSAASSPFASPFANRIRHVDALLSSLTSPIYRNINNSASASPVNSIFIDDAETVAGIDGEEPPWRPILDDSNNGSPYGRQRYPRSQYHHLYDIDLYTPSRPMTNHQQ